MAYPEGEGFYRAGVPGDNAPAGLRPEIIAAEQRILTAADALVQWMKVVDWGSPEASEAVDKFFTHETQRNPGGLPDDGYPGVTKIHILDKLDRDANRFFFDLLRAAWERRCWRHEYGEIRSPHEPGETS